jgi:hypothetical protein
MIYLVFALLPPAVLANETQTSDKTFSGEALTLPPGVARVLRVSSDVKTVIIGDPKVADASMLNERTVAVTAKAVGTTNMILLDESSSQIMQTMVQVRVPAQQVRTIAGGSLKTYSCEPRCTLVEEPSRPHPGTTIHIAPDALSTSSSGSFAVERGIIVR